jgi:hypothetical protein
MRLESVASIEEEQNLALINKMKKRQQKRRTLEGLEREERGFKFL